MHTIKVEVRTEYGNERIYPVTFQKELNTLTKQKTLSKGHIEALKKMGFNFEAITPSIEKEAV